MEKEKRAREVRSENWETRGKECMRDKVVETTRGTHRREAATKERMDLQWRWWRWHMRGTTSSFQKARVRHLLCFQAKCWSKGVVISFTQFLLGLGVNIFFFSLLLLLLFFFYFFFEVFHLRSTKAYASQPVVSKRRIKACLMFTSNFKANTFWDSRSQSVLDLSHPQVHFRNTFENTRRDSIINLALA